MDFNARVEGGCTIVSLHGRLDTVTAPECDRKFREAASDGACIIVDFDGVDYISSAGLRSVLTMAKLVKEKNGRIGLANVKGNVRTVFDLSGFDRVFTIKDSVEEAASELSSGGKAVTVSGI